MYLVNDSNNNIVIFKGFIPYKFLRMLSRNLMGSIKYCSLIKVMVSAYLLQLSICQASRCV